MFPTSFFECPTKDLGHEVSDNDMRAAYGSGDLGEHSGSGYSSPTSAPTLPEAVLAPTSSLQLSLSLSLSIYTREKICVDGCAPSPDQIFLEKIWSVSDLVLIPF